MAHRLFRPSDRGRDSFRMIRLRSSPQILHAHLSSRMDECRNTVAEVLALVLVLGNSSWSNRSPEHASCHHCSRSCHSYCRCSIPGRDR